MHQRIMRLIESSFWLALAGLWLLLCDRRFEPWIRFSLAHEPFDTHFALDAIARATHQTLSQLS